MRGRQRRKVLIISLMFILCIITAGYAAFQSNLNITSDTSVTSNWDIEITNVTNGTASGTAENTNAPTWDKLTAFMEANLYQAGDAMEYDVTISNKGTLDAQLSDVITNLENSNEAVDITFTGYTKGEKLYKGENKIIHVKIAYNPNYTGGETSSEIDINFDYKQATSGSESVTSYILTYDYMTNGGTFSTLNQTYLNENDNVDLSVEATKYGYTFVGWNTDKNAQNGLSTYKMPKSNATLYAIYKKALNVTYVKGDNVLNISKDQDMCNLYNLDEYCEVILPSIDTSSTYTALGWFNGSTKVGNASTTYKVSNSITLTAMVKLSSFTLTYDYKVNGGDSVSLESASLSVGDNADLSVKATKLGWTFVGWNTDKNAEVGLTSFVMPEANTTLYAIYRKEAITYTVTFNKNGALSQTNSSDVAVTDNTVTRSCTINAVYNNKTQATSCTVSAPAIVGSANTPTVVGYNTTATATSSVWNQKIAKSISSNGEYYAITTKEAKTVTITFDKNGALNQTNSSDTAVTDNVVTRSCTISATYNGALQSSACSVTSPTITGSSNTPNVIGYNSSKTGTVSEWNAKTAKDVSEDKTYYAITSSGDNSIKTYTVTFNKNGALSQTNSAGISVTDNTVTRSCSIPISYNGSSQNETCSITSPTIVGSSNTPNVVGYNTSSSATTSSFNQNTLKNINSNMTYFAITKNSDVSYTSTYSKGVNVSSISSSNGSCMIPATYNGKAQDKTCSVTLPSITANTGYTPIGFSTKSGDTTGVTGSYTLSGNVTLYANALDKTAPSVPTVLAYHTSETDKYTSGTWTDKQVYTKMSTSDLGSGVEHIQYSADNGVTWVTLNLSTSNGLQVSESNAYGVEPWTMTDGRNITVVFRAVDKAGNASAKSAPVNIKYDLSEPTLTISTTNTTNSVTVVANASAKSGINKYEYSKDGGKTWVTGSSNTYTFNNLTNNSSYDIKVRVTSGTSKQASTSKTVTTSNLPKATYSEVSVTGKSTVTITYPTGCGSAYTCSYSIDNGSTYKTVTTSTYDVEFTLNGSLIAKVSDGYNNAISTAYIVTIKRDITFDQNYLNNDIMDTNYQTYSYNSCCGTGAVSVVRTSDENGILYKATGNNGWYFASNGKLTGGKQYTYSFYAKASTNVRADIGPEDGGTGTFNIGTDWQRYTYTFTANADTTYYNFIFYGWWSESETRTLYIKDLQLHEGGLNISTVSKNSGVQLGTLTIPTRTGYTFKGWYTAPIGGTAISSSTTVPDSNATYYAQWTVNNYAYNVKTDSGIASFDINIDGSMLTNQTSYSANKPYKTDGIITNVKAKTGYTYTGYSVSGSLSEISGSTNTRILTTLGNSAGTITLNSKINTHTVTYDYKTNGGTSATKKSASVNYNSLVDLSVKATKSHWTFVGWNTDKNATSGLSSYTMTDADVTLYAIYKKEAITYTVTFNKNGALSQTNSAGVAVTDSTVTKTCTIAEVYNNSSQGKSCNITSPTIVGSSNTPTVVGYATYSLAKSSSWAHNTAKSISSNMNFYAITTSPAKTFTATYNKGANVSSISKTSDSCTIFATYNGVVQGSACLVTLPTITASAGYTSVGFSTTSGSATGTTGSYSLSGNITLYGNAVDKTAPVLSDITNSSNGNWATSITLKWTITETGSGISKVQYSFNNSTWNDLSSSEWYGLTRSNTRNDTLYIRAIDKAGNISNVKSTNMKIDTANPTLTTSTSSTTNSITVVANASATSGITKYEYSKDNGATWVTGDTKSYTFNGLTQNTSYSIKVRVTSGVGKTAMASTTKSTNSIPLPTFKEDNSSNVVITFPRGCGSTYTCSYKKNSEEVVTVTSATATVSFIESGVVVAYVSDGVSTINNSYNVEMIPYMMARSTSKAFWQSTYKDKISTVDVLTNKDVPSTAAASWDVSAKQNKSVMAWIIDDPKNAGMYKLYIGGKGGVYANSYSFKLFDSFSKITSINLANLDTSKVTNMNSMFSSCRGLTSLDLSNFDTSNVTNMYSMFAHCSSLISLDVSNFDTSKVTYMIWMFGDCSSLTSLDLRNFDTSKVTAMSYMFYSCIELTSLDVSNFDTSNVTDMGRMFDVCKKLTSLDVSNFDTSKVTDMNSMFGSCRKLTSLDVSKFDTSKVTGMSYMFSYCSSLTSLDVSTFNTSNVTDMSYIFDQCSGLTSLDVSNFDTSKATNMCHMFSSCSGLTSLDVSKFDTSKVTNMISMFGSCKKLTSLDVSNFDTSKVTNMMSMLYSCIELTSLDVSNFDTSQVTNISSMFSDCSGLTSLDVRNFDTSKVTNMYAMFDSCKKLTSLDVSNFDTSKVTNMSSMFSSCSGLTSLDLSNFDTSNVTSTSYMFYQCSGLTELNLCSFDTSKVTNMNCMFSYASGLTAVNVSSKWTSANATTSLMFNSSGVSSVTVSSTC